MNLDYKYLLDGSFHPSSRVWVYQSSRLFTISEALQVEEILNEFVSGWTSHGDKVKGAGHLFFGQFIILMADTSESGIGGCSTDTSVRMIKDIEKRFGVNLFDRTALGFVKNDRVELIPLAQFDYAVKNGFIDGDTLYFNNVIHTKDDLENKWIIPVKESWLKSRMPQMESPNLVSK